LFAKKEPSATLNTHMVPVNIIIFKTFAKTTHWSFIVDVQLGGCRCIYVAATI